MADNRKRVVANDNVPSESEAIRKRNAEIAKRNKELLEAAAGNPAAAWNAVKDPLQEDREAREREAWKREDEKRQKEAKSAKKEKRKGSWDKIRNATTDIMYWWYFLLTLFIHFVILYIYNSFSNVGMFIISYLLTFVFILGFYIWHHRDEPEEVRAALIATFGGLLVYCLPMLLANVSFMSSDSLKTIDFLVAYIPIWPLFMATRIENRTHSKIFHLLFSAWKLIIVIIVLVSVWSFLSNWGVPVFAAVDIGSPADVLSGAGQFVKETLEKIGNIKDGTWGVIDRATNPDTYYRGQVEEGSTIPLGVEIESLRVADTRVSNTSPILVFGTVLARPIKSQNYLGEAVKVRPTCVIESEQGTAAAVDPIEMDVVWGTAGQYECEFPPIGRKGTYTITSKATFPFQTWAYIEYTFIDDERARNLARQGVDISRELGISIDPQATYTNGPVLLGMGGTPQPIRIETDGKIAEGSRIGITLDSNWARGEILHVERLELKVPIPFKLDGESCDREPVRMDGEVDDKDPLLTTWVFDNPDIDPLTLYGSVTCKLVLDDKNEAEMIAQQDSATRSFIGAAYYTYAVKETTTVQVR